MKHINILVIAATVLLIFSGCTCGDKSQKIIGKPENVKIENRLLNPEALWAFGRLGEVAISPDGKQAAYSVRYFDIESNKGNTDIYIVDVANNNNGNLESSVKQLTKTAASEFNLVWRNDGKICFLRGTENGKRRADF